MTENRDTCFFCDRKFTEFSNHHPDYSAMCVCPNCGTYWVTFKAFRYLSAQLEQDGLNDERYIMSGYIRELHEGDEPPPIVSMDVNAGERAAINNSEEDYRRTWVFYRDIFNKAHPPKSARERMEKVICNLYKHVTVPGQWVSADVNQPALVYANNSGKYLTLLRACVKEGILSNMAAFEDCFKFQTTLLGCDYFDEIKRKLENTNASDNHNSATQSDETLDTEERRMRPKVFVVHGHDELTLLKVMVLLDRIGCEAINFERIPGKGSKTNIELLEETIPTCDAVVVLLTPDDEGRKKGDGQLKERARQNVLIEAGYALISRRDHSVIVATGGVDIPSDFDGISRVQGVELSKDKELELAQRIGDMFDLNILAAALR